MEEVKEMYIASHMQNMVDIENGKIAWGLRYSSPKSYVSIILNISEVYENTFREKNIF